MEKEQKLKQEKNENFACLVGAISFLIILVNIVFLTDTIINGYNIIHYISSYPVGCGICIYMGILFLSVFLKNPKSIAKTIIAYCMLITYNRFLLIPFFISPFIMLYLQFGIRYVGIILLIITTAPFAIASIWLLLCFSWIGKGAPITIATRIAKGQNITDKGFINESIGYGIAANAIKDILKK